MPGFMAQRVTPVQLSKSRILHSIYHWGYMGYSMDIFTKLCASVILVLCPLLHTVQADVQPGDVINKSNYQKIEGMVPDYILEWVKNGDLTMKIGKLAYDPKVFWSKEILDTWKANSKRYTVDDHSGIIDKTTGKPAHGIKGLPFPEPDPADPKMPLMLLWSKLIIEYVTQGNLQENQFWLSVTRSGLEKTVEMENLIYVYDPAKSRFEWGNVSVFRQPFNMAGTGTLINKTLYPMDNSIQYGYAPELRRLKRLSDRMAGCDAHFGFDNAEDDTWAGGVKAHVEEGVYRLIGERDAVVPYLSESPLLVDWNDKGELEYGYAKTGVRLNPGFETQGWTGAPWHFTNIIWVKTRCYIVESRTNNPNYAYGPCEGWIEKGTFSHSYKRITDPSGKLWKGTYEVLHAFGSKDMKFAMMDNFTYVEVDVRRDHGSTFPFSYREGGYKRIMVKNMKAELFTPDGFLKYAR
jgi:hypothetical protein